MATTSIHSITTTQVRALAYITNEDKTDNGVLVSSFMCSEDPDKAEDDFMRIQNNIGTGRNKVLAQHIVQSFKPGEVTPEQALAIGKELCNRFLKNEYQYILAVHTDKKHIHCHIVFNNINMDNGKTFGTLEDRKNEPSWKKLREISDEICKENGLSIVAESDKNKGKSWYEWDKNRQGQSWKTQLKFNLDECITESESFNDFLSKVKEKGIEVNYNPEHKIDLKFRMAGQQKWSRAKTLGWYYETAQIKRRIEQYKLFRTGQTSFRQKTGIIDTSSEKYQLSKSLERWASIHNMKEASKVINILSNQGIDNISDIESKSINDFSERMKLVKELNGIQRSVDELSDVIKAVRKVKKYKPIQEEYKSQKSDKAKRKFAEKYAPDLEKYKAASAFLKAIYKDGKVPSEESLTRQRNELIEQRNNLNEKYKAISEQIKELDYARQTIDDYLRNERDEKSRKKSTLE